MKKNDKLELRKLGVNELEIALVDAQKKYLELRLTSSKEVIKNYSFLKNESKKRIAVIKTFLNEKILEEKIKEFEKFFNSLASGFEVEGSELQKEN